MPLFIQLPYLNLDRVENGVRYVTTEPRPLSSSGKPLNDIGSMGKSRAELSDVKDEDLFTVTVSIKEIAK